MFTPNAIFTVESIIALKASGRDCTNNNELLHKIGVLQRYAMQLFVFTSEFFKRFNGAVSITVVLKESENKVEGLSLRLKVRAPVKPFLFFAFAKKQEIFCDLLVRRKSMF